MRFVIYVGRVEDVDVARRIMSRLSGRVEVVGARSFEAHELGIGVWDGFVEGDVAVVIGGDGTVLKFIHEDGSRIRMPILHIGTGRVNFLSDCTPNDVHEALDKVLRGEFRIEEKVTLKASVGDASCIALNEVLVRNVDPGRLLEVSIAELGGELMFSARMDGVIVSTPTGSTAYSLAAGGPIIDSRLIVKVIVPLAPFTRALAPIVHPYPIPLQVEARPDALIACDGIVLARSSRLVVEPSEVTVKMIRTSRRSFYERVWRRLYIP